MVNLTIRLNKGGGGGGAAAAAAAGATTSKDSGGGGGGGGAEWVVQAGVSNGRAACLDHLDVDDLPLVRCVGAPPAIATVNILGRKCQRKLGHKVHFCVRCNFPIAIYGRLDPCEHAFCLTCAKKDPICFLCEEKIVRIQKLEVLEGIYICGAPGCLRSFLKRHDFETHIKEAHKILLQRLRDKDEKAEPQVQTQSHPVQKLTGLGQSQPPSSAHPPLPHQPSQQQLQSSEDKPTCGQVKQSPSVSSGSQRDEKLSRSHQSKIGSHQQDRHVHAKAQHPQHQEQHQHSYASQNKLAPNVQDSLHNQQVQTAHAQQDKQHRPSHSEKQQLEKQHHHRPPHRPPQNQQVIPPPPPYPTQSFPSPYFSVQDGNLLPQPQTPRFDSLRFGPYVDQRVPVHTGVVDYQEKPRPRHSGYPSSDREGGPSSSGNQEEFMSMERQPPVAHYHSDFGPRGSQVMGLGMDRPPPFQDMPHGHMPPTPKRAKYGPNSPIGEGLADPQGYAWPGSASNFGPAPGFIG